MNNDKLKFVVDSRSFDGSCVTTMSDGIHGDYHHETLEELRDREKNPYLIAVSGNTVRKMIRIHLQSLCGPFSEITEERYFDYMDVLPPIRHTRNFFFLGEPYHADIYWFCLREYACSTARGSFPCICPSCSFCRERSSASSSGHSPSL